MTGVSDTRHIARHSASALSWNWLGSALRAVLQFVVQIALARLLGPEAYGQAAAAIVVVGLAWLVAEGGLGAALVQRAQIAEHDIACAFGWVLAMSALVSLALAAAAAPVASLMGDAALQPLVLACAVIVPLQALANLPSSLMQRQYRIKRLQALQVSGYLVAYGGVGIGMALAGFGAWSVVTAFGLHALWMLVGGLLSVTRMPWPRLSGSAGLRAYGWRTTAANVVNWGLESIDRVLINRFWGAASLGEYAVASNLSRAPATLLVGAVQPVAFASAARLQAEHLRLQRGYLAVLSLGLLLATPVFVFLAWHAQVVVDVLYGDEWRAAGPLFAVMCLGVPLFVMLAITGPMLRGLDAVGQEMRVQALALVVMVAGLAAVAQQPVLAAAALVACVSALRAVLVYRALAARLALPPGAGWRAWRGALVFAAAVVLASALCRFEDDRIALVASALLSLGFCLALLRWQPGAVLGPELGQALRNRSGDSRAAALLCSLAGWRRADDAGAAP